MIVIAVMMRIGRRDENNTYILLTHVVEVGLCRWLRSMHKCNRDPPSSFFLARRCTRPQMQSLVGRLVPLQH